MPHFPTSHSTLNAGALAAWALEHYPLSEPVRCRFHRKSMSDVYLVHAGDGEYVLKVYLHERAERGDPRACLIEGLLRRTERFLGTTLVGTNLAVVSSTTLADLIISRHCPAGWQTLANTLVMTPLILIVGELIPKSVGRAHADDISLVLAKPLRWAQSVLLPIVALTGWLADMLAGLVGRDPTHRSAYITRDDLRAIAEIATEEGLVPASAGSMLQTLFGLDKRSVSAAMVPLVDIRSIPHDTTVASVEALAVRTGFTRFPVYRGRIDEIIGVVDLRHVLYALHGERDDATHVAPDTGIGPFIQHDVVFVPETKLVGSLLHEMRYHRVPMAAVVDEHGGVVGVVTTEDLVEEVVGEIHDERDGDRYEFERVAHSVYECDGKLPARELTEHLGLEIEPGGYETVAGLVLKLAQRIPSVGERFRFGGYEIEVLELARRRVARVRFRLLADSEES